MVKVPRPWQNIFYNLFRDTFRQEFVQNSDSLAGQTKEIVIKLLYWVLTEDFGIDHLKKLTMYKQERR